jgi:hypothetical protein
MLLGHDEAQDAEGKGGRALGVDHQAHLAIVRGDDAVMLAGDAGENREHVADQYAVGVYEARRGGRGKEVDIVQGDGGTGFDTEVGEPLGNQVFSLREQLFKVVGLLRVAVQVESDLVGLDAHAEKFLALETLAAETVGDYDLWWCVRENGDTVFDFNVEAPIFDWLVIREGGLDGFTLAFEFGVEVLWCDVAHNPEDPLEYRRFLILDTCGLGFRVHRCACCPAGNPCRTELDPGGLYSIGRRLGECFCGQAVSVAVLGWQGYVGFMKWKRS